MKYIIIKQEDGWFRCDGRTRDDGTPESWHEIHLNKAIKSMKKFAKNSNKEKIRRKDITFLEEF